MTSFFGLLSGWITTTGTLLGPDGKKGSVSFPKTQQYLTSSGIELQVRNL